MRKEELIPIAIAVLGSPVLTFIITWLQQRNISYKRNQVLEQAGKRISFLESWYKAQQLVSAPEQVDSARELTQRQLDLTLEKLSRTSLMLVRPVVPYKTRPFFARAFLLFRPTSFVGWFVRVIFYLLLPFIGLVILGSALREDGFSLEELTSNWKPLLASLLVFFPVVLLMHWLAVRSELMKEAVGNTIDQLWIWDSGKRQTEPDREESDVDKSNSSGELKRHRRLGLRLLIVLLACWVGSSVFFYREQKLDGKAQDHYQKAQVLQSIGDLDAAIREYGQAIGHRRVGEFYYGRGVAYTQKGDYEPGISDFTEALKLMPNSPHTYNIYLGRARAYEQKGSDNDALSDYAKSIELEPRNPEAYFYRGRVLHRLKRPSDALVSYEAAGHLAPKDSDINWELREALYWELGEALIENNRDFSRALGLIQASSDAYKGNANYQASLGWALFKNGDSNSAAKHLQDAVRMGDSSPKTYERLGDVYKNEGYVTSAIDSWNNALKATTEPSDQQRLRGKIANASPPIRPAITEEWLKNFMKTRKFIN